ncbi:hypothetical protein CLAFUW4_08542 [Fulvia fulva]|uniref:DUF6604 domain-containing protein n=1 Tax=Passalora fulva TaxID=5499 RepID=A0A9Q8LC41_PASFU|nr:uncharacterized protein CLAFUR5_08644 [Fulvia fulva]KAK4629754.1 hypothetical protein CLAFUR4_08547 [Fulvia fulva]UJO14750.1 hypothetical protein CLAFUR5_08644 [Fulvia fulva]WPV12339.1 hypothetical protein CLAFUW4_08542 [Fulvia fulva]WPV27373.1 hypothetical protein CLAFUW7_08542 [Fulvia fulva]
MDWKTVADLVADYKTASHHVAQWLVNNTRGHVTDAALAAYIERAAQHGNGIQQVFLDPPDLIQLSGDVERRATVSGQAPFDITAAISVLKNAIRGRKGAAEWYRVRGKKDKESLERDEKHSQFIGTQSEMLACLQRAYRATQPIVQQPRLPARIEELVAGFCQLHVEEPAEVGPAIAARLTKDAAHLVHVDDVGVQMQVEPDDMAFALCTLLEEFFKARKVLREAWTSCKNGTLPSEYAFAMKEAANQLMQANIDHFAETHPGFDDFNTIADSLELNITTEEGVLQTFECNVEGLTSQLLCIDAWITVSLLRRHIRTAQLPRTHRAVRVLDRNVNAHHPLCLKLYESKVDVDDLAARWQDAGPQDLFTAQYAEFRASTDHRVSLTFILMLQNEIDALDILGEGRTLVLVSLVDVTVQAQLSSASIDELKRRYEPWVRHEVDETLDAAAKKIQHDMLEAAGKDVAELYEVEPADFLKRPVQILPTLGTAYSLNLTTLLHSSGVDLLNIGNIGLAMVHLYSICKASQLLSEEWIDMEFFIKSQGALSLGLIEAVHATEPMLTAARNYGFAMGLEAHHYTAAKAREPRKLGRVSLTLGRKNIRTVQLCSTFMKELHTVQAAASTVAFCISDELPSVLHHVAKGLAADNPSPLDAITLEAVRDNRPLTPVQLLSALKKSLGNDDFAMRFDYYIFFATLVDIVREVQLMLQESKFGKVRDVGKKDNPSLLVDDIFWLAACRERDILANDGTSPINDYISMCAKIFDRHMGKDGSRLYDMAVASRTEPALDDEIAVAPCVTPVGHNVVRLKLNGKKLTLKG